MPTETRELVNKTEIARRLGVDPSAVSQWIKRRQFPRPAQDNLYDWARIYAWAKKWKEDHPRSMPKIKAKLDEAVIAQAEADLDHLYGRGCTCQPPTINLKCPVHASP